jgi:hypothetical protein
MNKIIITILLLSCFFPLWLESVEVKALRKITLSQDNEIIIEKANSFIVTVDKRILVVDSKAANIKIFDMTGKRVKVFGRKGMGPDEFVRPRWSTYLEPFVSIMDYGRNMIFIYKRSGLENFEFIHKFLNLNLGYDFCFLDDQNLLVAGEKFDKNRRLYSLYEYNFKKDKYDFILPSNVAYGYTSIKQFMKDFYDNLPHIGAFQFFDVSDDSIFFVWTGDIKVIKIDRKTRKLTYFGNKTKNFIKPTSTPAIERAFKQRDHRLIYKLRRQMSYVRHVFVSNNRHVGVVYVGPFRDNILIVTLLLYTTGGEFLKEFELLNAKASHHYEIYFYFSKNDNLFYILDTETSKEFDQLYKIHEYRIEE